MRSATFGVGRADRYRESFLLAMERTRELANESIKKYRLHHDLDVVLGEVCGAYRALMK